MHSIYLKLRQLHDAYPFVALLLFIAAFLLAFVFMFIFPPVSLGLVFLGLFGLAAVVVFRFLIAAASSMLVRRLIRAGTCPSCGGSPAAFEQDCPNCGASFATSGKSSEAPGVGDLAGTASETD